MLVTYVKETNVHKDTELERPYTEKCTKEIHRPRNTTYIPTLEAHINRLYNAFESTLGKEYLDGTQNMSKAYHTFQIPKKSKGTRTINAPNEQLKELLNKIPLTFQKHLNIHPHNAAFAYVPHRNHLDALKKHKANKSKWFLKIDIKDFFPSCTYEILCQNLQQLYPFARISTEHQEKLHKILYLCCLDGHLPQGSPASPYLSNLLFTPIDYNIQKYLAQPNLTLGPKQKYVYTRYADDILISAKQRFNWQELVTVLQTLLDKFKINTEKTRFGSSAGRNWNLGLMLNKDNNITLGHERKRKLKATLCNLIAAYKEGIPIPLEEKQQITGTLSYAKQIEPEYINYIIKHYNTKFQIDLEQILHS